MQRYNWSEIRRQFVPKNQTTISESTFSTLGCASENSLKICAWWPELSDWSVNCNHISDVLGAKPLRALRTSESILKLILYCTGSQRSAFYTGVMWSVQIHLTHVWFWAAGVDSQLPVPVFLSLKCFYAFILSSFHGFDQTFIFDPSCLAIVREWPSHRSFRSFRFLFFCHSENKAKQ